MPNITDAQFQDLCDQYENYQVEYTADGELLVMPLADPETSSRNLWIASELMNWALPSGRGIVTESSGAFTLPNGARLCPDAAWISNERLDQNPTCPEFVVELVTPTDLQERIGAKMLEWIANGALLGWMINPRTRTVTIFRPNREPETLTGLTELAGEGPVQGFVLDLTRVWE
ncbi:MAG TPA: Uma2 family endonuclease [Bryobacteraceae bacterium]